MTSPLINDSNSSLLRTELGYYQVGNTVHAGKIPALIDGSARNIHPEWKFNNEFFDRVDWRQEPVEDLYELYRQRAQQLRERYDYLILMYSGGSDSQTILDVCLKNKIHIDEIVVSWATSLSNTYEPDANNYSWANVQSEWDFTIQPKLNYIAAHFPKIKITVNDWVLNIKNTILADDFIADRNHNFGPYTHARWDTTAMPSVIKQFDTNGKTGVIFGTDKPRICIDQGAYRLYFLDIYVANAPCPSAKVSQGPIDVELFYWSPASWKILAKQAHLICDWFEKNPQFKPFIQWPIARPSHRQFYETVLRTIIYPRMNLDFFQVEKPKPKDMHFGMDDMLFKIGYKDLITGMQNDNFTYLEKIIDKKYFQQADDIKTLVGFISGMWAIRAA